MSLVSLRLEDALTPAAELGREIASHIKRDAGDIRYSHVNPTGETAHIIVNGDIHYNLFRAGAGSKSDVVAAQLADLWNVLTQEQRAKLSIDNPELARALERTAIRPKVENAYNQGQWMGFFHTPETIRPRIEASRSGDDLIEGLIPRRSIVVVVADSGLGKTPFEYQEGFCIASGIDFLGRPTRQGRVLIVDYENGLHQMEVMLRQFSKYYNAPLPKELILLSANDAPPQWESPGYTLIDAIEHIRPDVTFIDSLGSAFPAVESKNENANAKFKQLRQVISLTGTSIQLLLHPPKQSGRRPEDQPERLEGGDLRKWFHQQTRGARALINTPDLRLAMEEHSRGMLLLRGFRRVEGEIPEIIFKRKLDANGKTPLAYEQVTGAGLLFNREQEEAFEKLPDEFAFKDAMHAYGKTDQPTKNWLEKCIDLGILQQPVVRGAYMKIRSNGGVNGGEQ
jgi:hypothetical protein